MEPKKNITNENTGQSVDAEGGSAVSPSADFLGAVTVGGLVTAEITITRLPPLEYRCGFNCDEPAKYRIAFRFPDGREFIIDYCGRTIATADGPIWDFLIGLVQQ